VEGFLETPLGDVPRVTSRLDRKDLVTAFPARTEIDRNGCRAAPGLYCAGSPDTDSPVFVTGNYKLSLAALRKRFQE
jgi:hypothetical protein